MTRPAQVAAVFGGIVAFIGLIVWIFGRAPSGASGDVAGTSSAATAVNHAAAPDGAGPAELACGTQSVDAFAVELDNDLRAQLGCAQGAAETAPGAAQRFEGGLMLWTPQPDRIIVLLGDHTWQQFQDTWVEDDNPVSCMNDYDGNAVGLPRRGFGRVWCDQPAIRGILGWAVESEHGVSVTSQSFEQGLLLAAESLGSTALLFDGAWQTVGN